MIVDNLIHNRKVKEIYRDCLTWFCAKQKDEDADFDLKSFVDLMQQSDVDILLLTGMRDGIDYARFHTGRVVYTAGPRVISPEECKSSRGWDGP